MSKDRRMDGLVSIPADSRLWPPSWIESGYKTYERFPRIDLPVPRPQQFGHELLVQRRSDRAFIAKPHGTGSRVSLEQLSNILYYSCGEVVKSPQRGMSRRMQPSAGALYPLEAYVLNFERGELSVKCYHYNVAHHALEELWDIPQKPSVDITHYFTPEWSKKAAMAIVLTAVVARSVDKYGERGYRYIYLEAGTILGNLHNNCHIEGLGSVILGVTNEKNIETLLDIDGVRETVILGLLIG